MMRFIKGMAAMKIKDYIAVSDLHVGFESEYGIKGYMIPSQTKNMIAKISKLKKYSKKLVILGDLKHSIILNYKKELLDFLSELSKMFDEIIIIKGNHDGGIERYTMHFGNISVKTEMLINDCLLIHGHKMASKENMAKAKYMLIGHFHSNYRFKNYLGKTTSLRTWNIYSFDSKKYYADKKIISHLKKVVSFPSFNEFFTGSSEKIGFLKNYINLEGAITLEHLKVL
jgi:hypothetical protein